MLKIKNIRLNEQKALNFDDCSTIVFGGNAVGKTLLVYIIDYLLGHSDPNIWHKQGMENVHSLECRIQYGESLFLFLKRTIDGSDYYKRSKEDEYLKVDLDGYKAVIQSCFSGYDKELYSNYYSIVGENLSFRGIAYLNFINQYSLGDSTNIIPEASDVIYFNRIKKQTMFLFNKEAQRQLNERIAELEELKQMSKKLNQYLSKREFAISGIKKEFEKLSLETADDVSKLRAIYKTYKEVGHPSLKHQKGEKELQYLAKAHALLLSQISIEKTLKKQTDLLTNRNRKVGSILEIFQIVLGDSGPYEEYYKAIETILDKYGRRDTILSVKDFDATIQHLIEEKNKVEQRMKDIKAGLTEKSYLDYATTERTIEEYFQMIDGIPELTNFDKVNNRIGEIKEEIDEIRENLKIPDAKVINERITNSYLKMPQTLDFVQEDLDKKVSVSYNPFRRSLSGTMIDDKGDRINYIPGSKARQTCWQIATFIELHKYIKEAFPHFPLLPILVIDGLSEPFAVKGHVFEEVALYFSDLCKENGIQLIVTSTQVPPKQCHVIDLRNGLNMEKGQG